MENKEEHAGFDIITAFLVLLFFATFIWFVSTLISDYMKNRTVLNGIDIKPITEETMINGKITSFSTYNWTPTIPHFSEEIITGTATPMFIELDDFEIKLKCKGLTGIQKMKTNGEFFNIPDGCYMVDDQGGSI